VADLAAPYGTMTYENEAEGRAICHFCGGAYRQVGTHSLQAHGIRSAEYRELVGLSESFPLSSLGWRRRKSAEMKQRHAEGDNSIPDVNAAGMQAAARAASMNRRGVPKRYSAKLAAKSGHVAYWSDLSHRQPSPTPRKHTQGQRCVICDVLFTPIKAARSISTGRILWSHCNRRMTCSEPCKQEMARRTNRVVAADGKLRFNGKPVAL
jgi:hypothetical protein